MDERQRAWLGARHPWLLAALTILVFGGVLVLSGGLTHDVRNDEAHFWETTRDYFVAPFPPSAESLRSYPELITPLSFILWGQLELLTGQGIFAGRIVNLLMALAIVLLLAGSRQSDRADGLVTVLGILAYPYFLALSIHLYTDMIAAFFVVFGLHFHLHGKRPASCVLFMLAIATRQFVVQIPAALATWEALRWRRKERGASLASVASPGLACASLLVWIAFWGGLSPQPGLDRWVPLYPAPMLSPFEFILHYGLYFVVCLGFYFAFIEALIFQDLPRKASLARPWVVAVALVLAVLFWISPPLLTKAHPGGAFGRAARAMLPGEIGDVVRGTLYYALALFGAVRLIKAGGLALLIAAAGTVMSMKSQIPWEKYLLVSLLPLWYLRSRPTQLGGLRAVSETETR